MEPIFKVGEKVRVKERVDNKYAYRYSFEDTMAELSGKTFTISRAVPDRYGKKYSIPDDNTLYFLEEDTMGYAWSSGMLERISEISSDFLIKPRKKLVLNFKI